MSAPSHSPPSHEGKALHPELTAPAPILPWCTRRRRKKARVSPSVEVAEVVTTVLQSVQIVVQSIGIVQLVSPVPLIQSIQLTVQSSEQLTEQMVVDSVGQSSEPEQLVSAVADIQIDVVASLGLPELMPSQSPLRAVIVDIDMDSGRVFTLVDPHYIDGITTEELIKRMRTMFREQDEIANKIERDIAAALGEISSLVDRTVDMEMDDDPEA